MLEEKVRARTAELWNALQAVEKMDDDLKVSHEGTIERLSIAAELRDEESVGHIRRVSRYCGLLSRWAGLDEQHSDLVRKASVLHDVGKIGIPDGILLNTGTLTPDEFAVMKNHADFGSRILSGSPSELLTMAATIALTHHERCDGTGYPKGLTKDEIPIEGRIAAIADVFDALTTNRIYRRAMGLPEALLIMKKGRGSHFDPELLDLFISHLDEVLKAKKLEDDRAP
jgi:putative two-component system response regulator